MNRFTLLLVLVAVSVKSQVLQVNIKALDTQLVISEVTVHLLNQTLITDNDGVIEIDTSNYKLTDTISFSHIAYQKHKTTLGQLRLQSQIYLETLVTTLENVILYANPPSAKELVKNIIAFKTKNYKGPSVKNKITIEQHFITHMERIALDLKENTTAFISDEKIKQISQNLPKHSDQGSLIKGSVYRSFHSKDSVAIKLGTINIVNTKAKNLGFMEQLENTLQKEFESVEEGTYWKIKTGIIGKKINEKPNTSKKTSKPNANVQAKNRAKRVKRKFQNVLSFTSLQNENQWEFLYKTKKYKYTFVGGLMQNATEVYVIDFKPKNGGKYKGRLLIDAGNNALIKADYSYAVDKHGKKFNLFGVKYVENVFKAQVLFKKQNGYYALQHSCLETGNYNSVNRVGSLIKKRKRFLFDKELAEIKIDVDFAAQAILKTEIHMTDHQPLTDIEYQSVKENTKDIKITNLIK